jgi:hypothetical protein
MIDLRTQDIYNTVMISFSHPFLITEGATYTFKSIRFGEIWERMITERKDLKTNIGL